MGAATHKGKKIAGMVLVTLVLILAIVFVAAWCMFGKNIKSAMSVKEVSQGLYYMEYQGDYGFDEFMQEGGAASDNEMASYIISFLSNGFYQPEDAGLTEVTPGCSTLYVSHPQGGYLMGRNFDWDDCQAMVVHTKPVDGYESYSTCCLDFLDFGDEWKPEGFTNQYMSIAAIYVPMDGMNEKGLMIADLLAGDNEETRQDTDKADVTTVSAIREILDHAATVEEAIELLESLDMNSSIGWAHHYMIADASGHSVAVEYVNDEMVVTKTPILTNHYLAKEKEGIGSDNSKLRFDQLYAAYDATEGSMDQEELRENMSGVAAGSYADADDERTQWTVLFDPQERTLWYYRQENYETPITYSMK